MILSKILGNHSAICNFVENSYPKLTFYLKPNLVSPQGWEFLLSDCFFDSENPCLTLSSKTPIEAHGSFS